MNPNEFVATARASRQVGHQAVVFLGQELAIEVSGKGIAGVCHDSSSSGILRTG
jgi:hypothetical protein